MDIMLCTTRTVDLGCHLIHCLSRQYSTATGTTLIVDTYREYTLVYNMVTTIRLYV